MMMKFVRPVLAGLALMCLVTNLAAKSTAADGGYYTEQDKEFYLTADEIFFIRPGLELMVLDIVIPADLQPLVTFSMKDPGGLPLDINGVYTPGPVDMRYYLTYIPQGEEEKVRYTEGTRDSGGTVTALGDGVYTYKFGAILPATYEVDATHTLGLVGRRDLREFDLDRYVHNVVHDFVPSGMYDPVPRDIVRTDTCNRCHDPLGEHGGRYQEIGICTQCHNPGLVGRRDGLSEIHTLSVIVHEEHKAIGDEFVAGINACETCHTGGTPTENFPLAANPNPVPVCDKSGSGVTELTWGDVGPYQIRVNAADGPLWSQNSGAGSGETGKWVQNATSFYLVDRTSGETLQTLYMDTTALGCVDSAPATFVGTPATQHTNWLDHPSRLVCGSCHDEIDFAAGEGHLAQDNDNSCHFCHKPGSGVEFDASIRGAHMQLYKSSQFPGIFVELMGVTDTDPGDKPTVAFEVKSKTGPVAPLSLDRLNMTITGPNEDFAYYNQESVGQVGWNGEAWTYTFDEALPLDASGSYTLSVEGRSDHVPIVGYTGSNTREYMENPMLAFAVTGDVETRRMAVDDSKCESCHVAISLHGNNRKSVQYCNTCHHPSSTDEEELLPGAHEQAIHMKYMIHKIHRGADAEYPYVVAGHNQSVHEYGHVEYPGDLRNCEACHVNDSYEIPLPEGLLATTTPQEWWDPMMPIASACISCHDSDAAAAHAYSNTAFFGEACASCHGDGMSYSVDKVHAR